MIMETRGVRNNNPANIRRGSNWKGLRSIQTDKDFCQFVSVQYGIRAFFVLMRTYHYKYHLNSIKDILHVFAPLCENNTYSYISSVCKLMNEELGYEYNIVENTIVNCWYNPKEPKMILKSFAKAVFYVECGVDYCEYISDSIKLM